MIFVKGLLFGLTLQLAVGPVFFAVFHKAIKEGFAEALKMICGVALVDAFYIGVSFTGVSVMLQITILKKIICWCGALILIYLGSTYFWTKSPRADLPTGISLGYSSLLYGIKLTSTNPLTIIFWSGVFGALIGTGSLSGLSNILLFSSGCIAATLLFLSVFSLIGGSVTRFLTSKTLQYLDYTVGGFLILCGAILLFQ